jgi:hypothetical protein
MNLYMIPEIIEEHVEIVNGHLKQCKFSAFISDIEDKASDIFTDMDGEKSFHFEIAARYTKDGRAILLAFNIEDFEAR